MRNEGQVLLAGTLSAGSWQGVFLEEDVQSGHRVIVQQRQQAVGSVGDNFLETNTSK